MWTPHWCLDKRCLSRPLSEKTKKALALHAGLLAVSLVNYLLTDYSR